MSMRRKSLLIGINYVGSKNQLGGCQDDVRNVAEFLYYRGYPSDRGSQVIMMDTRESYGGPYFPTGHNMLAAMDWLVRDPDTMCFLHYSGHGSQVPDPDGDREGGFDDTIVPVDFETHGQLDSDTLHRHLVSALHPTSSLFIVFDCCHSGSAVELPFVYRTDDEGNVNMVDNVKQGLHLMGAASSLLAGGFTFQKISQAEQLYAGARDFFQGLRHANEPHEAGLQQGEFQEDWASENKRVTMFSGCRDDQTSADATIAGSHVGAMSWAFLNCMRERGDVSYVETLQETRRILVESNYQQVPQLSVGVAQMDLNAPLYI